jgi:hypothetical protein
MTATRKNLQAGFSVVELMIAMLLSMALAGAIKIAAEAPKGANILAMLPDTAERYLSTPLFPYEEPERMD